MSIPRCCASASARIEQVWDLRGSGSFALASYVLPRFSLRQVCLAVLESSSRAPCRIHRAYRVCRPVMESASCMASSFPRRFVQLSSRMSPYPPLASRSHRLAPRSALSRLAFPQRALRIVDLAASLLSSRASSRLPRGVGSEGDLPCCVSFSRAGAFRQQRLRHGGDAGCCKWPAGGVAHLSLRGLASVHRVVTAGSLFSSGHPSPFEIDSATRGTVRNTIDFKLLWGMRSASSLSGPGCISCGQAASRGVW